jgi:hypothetical protein
MGIFTNEIIFDYPAPKLERIIEEIENISGLPVLVVDPNANDSAIHIDECEDDEEELYDFYQDFAFNDFPNYSILIYAYIPNAVNNSVEKEKLETGFDANWPRSLHGADEEEGKQSIHLESYVGSESTLFLAAINALESLGGTKKYKISLSYALKDYPITIENLKKNYERVKRKILFKYLLSILLLPIIIPLVLIKMIFSIIKMPFEINRGMKAIKKHYPDEFNSK